MPTPTYDLIDSVTLTSKASSVTFSGIAADWDDIVIVAEVTAEAYDSWFGLRFNGNSSSSYASWAVGNGTSTYQNHNQTEMRLYSHLTTTKSIYQINIADYPSTSKKKAIVGTGGGANSSYKVGMFGGLWQNTSAITSIYLFGGGGLEFASGSIFRIFGVVA